MSDTHSVIEVFFKGKKWSLGLTGKESRCYFGGPISDHVETKINLKKAALHNLGTLNLPKFNAGFKFGFSLPLLYGICHEGCEIEYKKTATSALEITQLEPKKAEAGYPYHPLMLPYYELGIVKETEIEDEILNDALYNTGWDPDKNKLYAIVKQHPHIGHCLFEPGGGAVSYTHLTLPTKA